MKQFLFILLSSIFFNSVYSQVKSSSSLSASAIQFNNSYRLKIYNQDNGISQDIVTAVHVDKNNILWIGTQTGLNKFDGYNFDLLLPEKNNPNSISSGHIKKIFEDSDGNIWLLHNDKGINKINSFTNKIDSYNFIDSENNQEVKILAIAEDRNKNIIVGANSNYIWIKKHNEQNFKKVSNKLGYHVLSFCRIDGDDFLVGTSKGGIKLFNSKTQEFTNLQNDYSGFDSSTVREIIKVGKNDFIFIYNQKYVVGAKIEGNLIKDFIILNKFINFNPKCLYKDSKGKVWIGTTDKGLYFYNLKTNEFISVEKNNFSKEFTQYKFILDITQDYSNGIWIGTEGGGLVHLNFNKFNFKTMFASESENQANNIQIAALHTDQQNNVWCSTRDSKILTRANLPENTKKVLASLKLEIYALYRLDDVLFIGTNNGIQRLNLKTGIFLPAYELENKLKAKFVLGFTPYKGKLIVSYTFGGFAYISLKNIENYHNQLNDKILKNYSEFDAWTAENFDNNFLVIGNKNDGIYFLDDKLLEKKKIPVSKLSSNNSILDLKFDRNNFLWIGYENGGIDVLVNPKEFIEKNDEPKIINLNRKSGLPNESVMCIEVDNSNNIWVSTTKGLFKLIVNKDLLLKTKTIMSVMSFYKSEGLTHNEFNALSSSKSANRNLYFGSNNGILYFNPDSLVAYEEDKKVFLKSVKIFGQELDSDTSFTYKKKLNLNYNQNFISFDFSVVDFTNPEKYVYYYKMEGFDEKWVNARNSRFANYTNLSPGEYTFRVFASTSGNAWNEKGAEIKIIITPPFYKTGWFYTLSTLAFIGFIYLIIKRREAALTIQNRLLEEKVNQRTLEIKKINADLFKKNTDITDSINYAKRIQEAFLQDETEIQKYFNEGFVFFKPKDIVSGDFYWFGEIFTDDIDAEKTICLAVADCTGHGVPGALMSMIGIDRITEIANKTSSTGKMLSMLNQSIKNALKQDLDKQQMSRDGMDIALCTITYFNDNRVRLRFSAANRPLWLFKKSKNEIVDYKPDKVSIGGFTDYDFFFSTSEYWIDKGDIIYLFTDGYCDQFGGEKQKKYLTKRFRTFLSSIAHNDLASQNKLIQQEMEQWKGNEEQVDDLLVLGIRV